VSKVSIPSAKLNIAIRFGVEILEWFGYPMMKKFDDMSA